MMAINLPLDPLPPFLPCELANGLRSLKLTTELSATNYSVIQTHDQIAQIPARKIYARTEY